MFAVILTITLLTPAGEHVEVLPQHFNTRAECNTEKAFSHAATLPNVSQWRVLKADCTPVTKSKHN